MSGEVRIRVISTKEQTEEWMKDHLLKRIAAGEPHLDLDTCTKVMYQWSKKDAITSYEATFRPRASA